MKNLLIIIACLHLAMVESSEKRQALQESRNTPISINSNPLKSSNPITIQSTIKDKRKKDKRKVVESFSPSVMSGSLTEEGSPNTYFHNLCAFGYTGPKSISPHIPK